LSSLIKLVNVLINLYKNLKWRLTGGWENINKEKLHNLSSIQRRSKKKKERLRLFESKEKCTTVTKQGGNTETDYYGNKPRTLNRGGGTLRPIMDRNAPRTLNRGKHTTVKHFDRLYAEIRHGHKIGESKPR